MFQWFVDLQKNKLDFLSSMYINFSFFSRHGMTTRGSQLIEVTFHVIVTYNCAQNPNSDLVYLGFINAELGGWNELKYQMHPKK